MRSFLKKVTVLVMACMLLSGCSKDSQLDDYATNLTGNNSRQSAQEVAVDKEQTETVKKGISKDEIKVGVLHLSDPAEGSGYTYTHDLGIQGMQQNLGLSDSQIVRKINVDDSDEEATEKAIKECIDAGCNIIFTTSWGYMETTAKMAEEYPDVYFSHGTGNMSNGRCCSDSIVFPY